MTHSPEQLARLEGWTPYRPSEGGQPSSDLKKQLDNNGHSIDLVVFINNDLADYSTTKDWVELCVEQGILK